MEWTRWLYELEGMSWHFLAQADEFAKEFSDMEGLKEYSSSVQLPSQYWLIGACIVAFVGFAIYRWIDWLQIRHIAKVEMPTDLEKMTEEIYEKKRKSKSKRAWKNFVKVSASWGVQFGYILGGMPLLVIVAKNAKFSDGTIYMGLIVISWLLNMLMSKVFSLWTPTLLWANRPHSESIWKLNNMAFQAWGVVSWAGPVYFLAQYGAKGWYGSVAWLWVSQVLQLLVFIFSIKKKAIPYQDYKGLSDGFKASLKKYLAGQGLRDDEVGVIQGMGVGPNAFATGIFGYRQMIMTEELIKGFNDPSNPNFEFKLGDDSLEAIVAHEVGHIKGRHVMKALFVGALFSSITTVLVYFIFASKAIPPDYFFFDRNTSSQIFAYFGQSFFNIVITIPLNFMMISLIRYNEYEADTHLLNTDGCKNGKDFFHQIRHVAPVPNHPMWDRCNATHPAPHTREKRMIEWEKEHC